MFCKVFEKRPRAKLLRAGASCHFLTHARAERAAKDKKCVFFYKKQLLKFNLAIDYAVKLPYNIKRTARRAALK